MATKLVPCVVCKGAKTQTLTVSEHGKPGQQVLTIACIHCEGKGEVTPRSAQATLNAINSWCTCKEDHGSTYHPDDDTNPVCRKHHYTCNKCGKITQVG